MTTVFDAHGHCFPPLGEDRGHMADRIAEHLYHERFREGIRRRRDNVRIDDPLLQGEGDGISWLPEVDFRMGPLGQVEFTHEGQEYYYQWLLPSNHDLSFPPEYLIAHMDHFGVDRAVIQHDHIYGRLDEYLGDCVSRYPDRFVVLAQVDEWVGGQPDQLERVRRQVEEMGFRGVYFSTGGFYRTDFKVGVNDPELEPLWELVARLGVPVHWYAGNNRRPRLEAYRREIVEFTRWAQAHPHIPSVLTHGVNNISMDRKAPDRFSVPEEIITLIGLPNWHLELMLHVMNLDAEFPPYNPELCDVVRKLVQEVGADKLMWGSDMPSCERVVTLGQSMLLFKTQCDFLTQEQRAGILGGNLERLYPQ